MLEKIYGPYKTKEGRLFIIIKRNKKLETISYPKYLMEKYLGRPLKENETVHHIDYNFTNNNIANLMIIDRSNHSRLHSLKNEYIEFKCPICNKYVKFFGKKMNDTIQNRKRGKRGPFCSRSCAGKASHNIKNYKCVILVKKFEPLYGNI